MIAICFLLFTITILRYLEPVLSSKSFCANLINFLGATNNDDLALAAIELHPPASSTCIANTAQLVPPALDLKEYGPKCLL